MADNRSTTTGEAGNNWVLVIDDDPAAQQLIARTLTRNGYQVKVASDGVEGLRTAKKCLPMLITLDIDMPRLDGWAVLAALKADSKLSNIPVVIISTVDEKNRGIGAGVNDYFVKPLDRSRLITVLRNLGIPSNIQSIEPSIAPSQVDEPIRILVVEDDPANREIMVRTLHREGWTVTEADSGRAGLRMATEDAPDLIVLDLGLPELDGFGFLHELRKTPQGSKIPVVVVSAKNLSLEERSTLKTSVSRVFQKGSYSRTELLSCLRGCLSNPTSSSLV